VANSFIQFNSDDVVSAMMPDAARYLTLLFGKVTRWDVELPIEH
jgi:hypothetical protein